MSPDTALALGRDASWLIVTLAGPLLGAGLAVGLAVSLVQAITQVQEASLSFIPKLAAMLGVLALLGHWMLGQLLNFTAALLTNLPSYAR
jgi:flagellar biosynthetic protein FliQ